jgi:hypothetical protein
MDITTHRLYNNRKYFCENNFDRIKLNEISYQFNEMSLTNKKTLF